MHEYTLTPLLDSRIDNVLARNVREGEAPVVYAKFFGVHPHCLTETDQIRCGYVCGEGRVLTEQDLYHKGLGLQRPQFLGPSYMHPHDVTNRAHTAAKLYMVIKL